MSEWEKIKTKHIPEVLTDHTNLEQFDKMNMIGIWHTVGTSLIGAHILVEF